MQNDDHAHPNLQPDGLVARFLKAWWRRMRDDQPEKSRSVSITRGSVEIFMHAGDESMLHRSIPWNNIAEICCYSFDVFIGHYDTIVIRERTESYKYWTLAGENDQGFDELVSEINKRYENAWREPVSWSTDLRSPSEVWLEKAEGIPVFWTVWGRKHPGVHFEQVQMTA